MRNKFLGTGTPGYHPLRKIKIIFHGLRYAILNDFSVMYKIILSIIIAVMGFYFHEFFNVVLIILATGVVLISELFNSSIEAICDYYETEYNEKIKIIKDIAAAAAGVSIFIWLIVVVYESHNIWYHLFLKK